MLPRQGCGQSPAVWGFERPVTAVTAKWRIPLPHVLEREPMSLRLRILEDGKENNEPARMESLSSSLSDEQQYNIEERAAIMEFDGRLSREDAERQAWKSFRNEL